MDVAALVTWLLAAAGGFVLLGTWLAKGGPAQARTGESRLPPAVLFGHFLLAAAGLVLWIVYLVSDESAGLAWTAFVILIVVALLGFTMFARWLAGRRSAAARLGTGTTGTTGTAVAAVAAEQRFPVAVVLIHGLVGAVTLVLVLITALTI
jgi:manganese efflux pump family protein